MMAAESSSSAASSEEPAMAAAAAATGKLPTTGLSTDTLAAAPGNATEGFGYVGVWAVDAAGCAAIDQPAAANFAVVTTSTFRDGPKAYFGNFAGLVDGKLSVTVRAAAGTRTIAIEQAAPDTLTVDGKALIRCVP